MLQCKQSMNNLYNKGAKFVLHSVFQGTESNFERNKGYFVNFLHS